MPCLDQLYRSSPINDRLTFADIRLWNLPFRSVHLRDDSPTHSHFEGEYQLESLLNELPLEEKQDYKKISCLMDLHMSRLLLIVK